MSCLVRFFFKQKTAYEVRISDWEFRRVLFRSGEDASAGQTPPKVAAPKAEESKPAASEPKEAPKAEEKTEAKAAEPKSEQPASSEDDRVKASPLARRIAADKGIDLSAVEGTGPGGRIVKADVEGAKPGAAPATKAAAAAPTAPPQNGRAAGRERG